MRWQATLGLTLALLAGLASGPAIARDSLGIFEGWGAFRDARVPRCYAIAQPVDVRGKQAYKAYASIGYWPKRRIRGQLHIRLSRPIEKGATITASAGGRRFGLVGGGGDVWAKDARMDAAIIAALRSSERLVVTATDEHGNSIRDVYALRGAATAMDAAALGCARLN